MTVVDLVQRVRAVGHAPAGGDVGVHHPADRLTQRPGALGQRRGLGGDAGEDGEGVALRGIRTVALDGGEERGAEGPHVRGRRGVGAAGELGGEVGRRADHQAGLGELVVGQAAGDAEVGDLGDVVVGDQDVAGLDVAMHHPERVRRGQPVGDLGADPRSPDGVHGPLGGGDLRQGAAGDIFHHQPQVLPLLHRVVDRDDVAVVERGGGAGLAHCAGQVRQRLTGQVSDALDRHLATEPLVVGQPDAAHPSPADLTVEAVATGERSAGGVRGAWVHQGEVPTP
ncbi:hypothetical protein SAMN05216561_109142 [Nocardioides psychrotolerans]|uniref:Uncharacterized protein n=1 Tax=Nocardioides psychrotolerans TaxID=1005945 RepID=A0A1I3ITU1_9ACTN|nr:hypothetical protein SAMN05216561_109142 [Nocardioides psychrotolerans]